MDTMLAEFNRRKSEHNHTGKVIDTNFQSVIYQINFSQVSNRLFTLSNELFINEASFIPFFLFNHYLSVYYGNTGC